MRKRMEHKVIIARNNNKYAIYTIISTHFILFYSKRIVNLLYLMRVLFDREY